MSLMLRIRCHCKRSQQRPAAEPEGHRTSHPAAVGSHSSLYVGRATEPGARRNVNTLRSEMWVSLGSELI